MKHFCTLFLGIAFLSFSSRSFASIEIYCPKDKDITYQAYNYGHYWDQPTVTGPHTLYGPWIYEHLNCGSGYVDVKWEIVDHYARSYYCTQTIWVTNSYGSSSPVSVWCPKEQTVYCDELDHIKYNKPEVNGYNYTIYGPYISKSLNDCGLGSLWVEWKIVDGCGKITYCKSVVWVKARNYTPYIWWPKDFEADPCKDNVDPKYLSSPYGYPDISQGNNCSKYGISYRDEIFTFPNDPGICMKIVRHWSVIDWCTYNPNGYGYESNGKWDHVQLIKLINKTKPTIACTNEIKVNQESYGKTSWVDIPLPKVTSSCNGGTTITHNSKYATKPMPDASGQYPIGTTEVVFTVTDACGNAARCTTKVIVLDKTAPTPYCISSLVTTVTLQSDGVYTVIDPRRFDVGSYDNITPKEKLTFEAIPSKFTCDSLGTRKVKIWVKDEAGNKDYCTVKIILQDNMGMCPKKQKDTLFIAGLISNAQDKPIDNISLTLTDSTGHQNLLSSGPYKFIGLNHGMTYDVKPFKQKDFLQGVTTEDYTLLVDIVQGKDTFSNPYQLFAADIDRNDTINMDDVFLLGYYLLTKGEDLPVDQASWRFIPKKYNMSSMHMKSNVVDSVPDHLVYKKLDSVQLHADFLGIKIGDINLSLLDTLKSLSPNLGLETRGREVTDHPMLKGNMIKIYPNPFNESVSLVYNSNATSPFNLTILDLSGRIVYREKCEAMKGLNKITLNASRFDANGIYFYRLEGFENSYSGKLYRLR